MPAYQAYLAMAAVWLWATGKRQEVQGVLQFTSATLSKCVPWLGPQVTLSKASQAVWMESQWGKALALNLVWLLSLILGLVLTVQVITEPWKLQNSFLGVYVILGFILVLFSFPCPHLL